MSGAITSIRGPITGSTSSVNRRVSRSFSPVLKSDGSQATPPFAPANGRFMIPHFQLIHMALAAAAGTTWDGMDTHLATGEGEGRTGGDAGIIRQEPGRRAGRSTGCPAAILCRVGWAESARPTRLYGGTAWASQTRPILQTPV